MKKQEEKHFDLEITFTIKTIDENGIEQIERGGSNIIEDDTLHLIMRDVGNYVDNEDVKEEKNRPYRDLLKQFYKERKGEKIL